MSFTSCTSTVHITSEHYILLPTVNKGTEIAGVTRYWTLQSCKVWFYLNFCITTETAFKQKVNYMLIAAIIRYLHILLKILAQTFVGFAGILT